MGIRAQPQHLTITGALALALCLLALLAAGPERAYAQVEDYKPGEVIVKLNTNTTTIDDILLDPAYAGVDRLDVLGEDFPQYNLESEGIYLLKAPDNDAMTFVGKLLADTDIDVVYAEPNYIAEVPEDPSDSTFGDARFRARVGSKYSSQANTTFDENLNLSCSRKDFKGAKVAVLDTGAQLGHPRLEANFRKVKRYDFVDNDATPSDQRYYRNEAGELVKGQLAGHGTHVSGIVDKVAPGAKIMPLRVLDPDGIGDVYTVARAIAYAQDREVAVINLSLGSSNHSELLEEMIEEATAPGNDITVVAAAGNEDAEKPHYPAAGKFGTDESPSLNPANDGLLAVTSLDKNEVMNKVMKSDFANYGEWVDIAAPGEDIRSTFLRDKYAIWSGTSMATPFISGQAALIRAGNGTIPSMAIEAEIRDIADDSIYDFDLSRLDDPQYVEYWTRTLGKVGFGHANVCDSLDS
jgi:thermitase